MNGNEAATPPSDGPPPDSPAPGGGPPRVPRHLGLAAGVAALLVALGSGHLVAGLHDDLDTPVVSVGDRVVDNAPAAVQDWAISVFGTDDKTALLTGIVVLLALLAVAAGNRAVRGRRASTAGLVAVVTVAGMAAGASGRNSTTLGWIPSAVAGAATIGALTIVHRAARAEGHGDGLGDGAGTGARSRRAVLRAAAGLGLGGAVMGATGQLLSRPSGGEGGPASVRLRSAASPLAAPPTDPAAGLDGLSPLLVPNREFYRIDTALVVPRVDASTWSLRIDGMVERPLQLRYEELWDRALVEYDIMLSCVSNEVGGDLAGSARWVGVRLDELLAEAGVRSGADQIMGHSVDGFTAGFPLEAALDGRDAIIALAMNGEVLPVAHGYPARVVVPGLYGYVSATKWLSRLEVTRFDLAEGYWIPRGWAVRAPIKIASRIDVPGPNRRVSAGEAVIGGVAWAPLRGIERVEVQIDGGAWLPAELGPALGGATWRQWWLPWHADAGRHTLRCRATDGAGTVQTGQEAPPLPDGATGWHRVLVDVEG